MNQITRNLLLTVFVALWTGNGLCAQETDSLKKGVLLYENTLSGEKQMTDWVMEGPGVLQFRGGAMQMHSPREQWHHVLWCRQEFPSAFIAEWEVRNMHPTAGLLIVFFAAAGTGGQDIFDASLPPRDGTFKHYTKESLHNYHISYYADNPKNPERELAHLRKNSGFVLVQEGPEGIPKRSAAIHRIRLVKDGAHILFFIDDRKIIDWTDDGVSNGPVHQGGKIGFRQMQWSHFAYRNFKVWSIQK